MTCFDCHVNGHTNGATHLVGDIRPQEFSHRIETPSLRGMNIQRLFGSQRALKTVEDFTEFEQRAAYFDGDISMATKKGVNVLERGSQVHFMAEFLEILDFPPASKLDIYGALDSARATPAELRGAGDLQWQGPVRSCHPSPYYTDNTMHDLKAESFYKQELVNGMMMAHDGPIKTFPLRGIKDSLPICTMAAAHVGGHGGVLQSCARSEVDRAGKDGCSGLSANLVRLGALSQGCLQRANGSLVIH